MPIVGRYIVQQLTSTDVGRLKELLRVFGKAFGETDTYQAVSDWRHTSTVLAFEVAGLFQALAEYATGSADWLKMNPHRVPLAQSRWRALFSAL
jgi:hypothetical protein